MDYHFIIDSEPGSVSTKDGLVVVISACSGHGFKFGPLIGNVVSSLVCGEETQFPFDINFFSANRFKKAGLTKRIGA